MALFDTLANTAVFDENIKVRCYQRAQRFALESALPLLHQEVGNTITDLDRTYLQRSFEEGGRFFQEIAEGAQEAVTFEPRTVAVTKHYSREMAIGFKVSQRMLDTKGRDYVMRHVDRFMELALRTVERDWFATFINGAFTLNAVRDQRDLVPLCATNHPAGQMGAVWANTPGTPSALTESTLSAGIAAFASVLDDSGMFAPIVTADLGLLVHPTRYAAACQIVNSISTLTDYKNSGVKNLINGYGIKIRVLQSAYQVSQTQWSLFPMDLPKDPVAGLDTFFLQKPTAPEKKVNRDPNWIKWHSRYDCGYAVGDPRVIYSNAGA